MCAPLALEAAIIYSSKEQFLVCFLFIPTCALDLAEEAMESPEGGFLVPRDVAL